MYEPSALADAPPASSLPDGPASAVDDAGAPAFDASQDWKVVHQSDERVELLRELDEPVDKGGDDVRTHESRTLERITDAGNVADGTWLLTSAGRCAQRLVTDDDLGDADLALAASSSVPFRGRRSFGSAWSSRLFVRAWLPPPGISESLGQSKQPRRFTD